MLASVISSCRPKFGYIFPNKKMFFSDSSNVTEDFCFDKATRIRLNTNMIDYKKSTILDMDPVTSIINETRSGNAAYGANGILHPPAMLKKVLQALGKD